MNRRAFLSLAGGAGTYSLFCRVDDAQAETAAPSFETIAPADAKGRRFSSEPHMKVVDLTCDVLVAGGGMAGVCAALAAARHGAKTILVQDRSRLGGNASSEVKMHIVGANAHQSKPGWREGGIIEELRLEDAANNPQRSWEMWDLLLYDKCVTEPNLTLLLDTTVFGAKTGRRRIQEVAARCDKTEHLYRIHPKMCLDCTGDCRLALEAGADMRRGRESKKEFNEPLALEKADGLTLGSSILFTSKNMGRPVPFTPPKWARKITAEQLKFRRINSWEYGYWWIEWGGHLDTIREHERIRFELLRIVMGIWDYIKNSGAHPGSADWAMDWIGMVPGKRGSRRINGDVIMTQHDLSGGNPPFDDAVAIGGWAMDDHPPGGFDLPDQRPYTPTKTAEVYNIPLRALYSRSLDNLFMAGRNVSASHVAFTSLRVMATGSVMGQAAGTAAAACARQGLTPRRLYADKTCLKELQQTLLRDDQTIKGLKNEDNLDLARQARVTASASVESSRPENVINGFVRDMAGEWNNRWGAPMTADGAWIELSWDRPQTIGRIQLTFDTGFQRQLMLSCQDSVYKNMILGPQPETVRNYEILYTDTEGQSRTLVAVEGNYQRLRRHVFAPVEAKAIRIRITATNGADTARIFEVRCYDR